MRLGIGIDTGGSYTDAVIYDFDSGKILGSAKSLTTKEDLTIGILGALDGLPEALVKQAELLALSTTLATNACVEDKGGSAKLIFFGGDRKIIDKLGGKYGLPPSNDIYIQESYTSFTGEMEREPDWERFREGVSQGFEGFEGVGIVEMNAMKNGGAVERRAKEILRETLDVPVVCGHELFSELNSLQRAASTLLNARLFPVIGEFMRAIRSAMKRRGIRASVVIVRSDGSLMSEEMAAVRPVETLLCGPAASVLGGTRLSGDADSIVVDMGGTTTDIALVKNHIPVTELDGVRIGKWKTFVDGLYVKTLGLGGDSGIHARDGELMLEEYRVVPLCVAAERYPVVLENLKSLVKKPAKHTKPLQEHYMLIRDISGSPRYTKEERAFCDALKNGPLSFREAPLTIGKDMYTLNVSRLLRDGVVLMCGLTPTDIMHIRGDFSRYSREASLLGAQHVAFNLDVTVDELCGMVYDEVKRRLYTSIAKVLLENKHAHYMKDGVDAVTERFIDECYQEAKRGERDRLLSLTLKTDFTLVGIGAPIRVFAEEVAEMLGTKAFIPEHFEVANALGAVVGNVSATHSVEIRPNYGGDGIEGYTVFGGGQPRLFKELEDAERYASGEAEQAAREEAVRRGAKGELTVTCRIDVREGKTKSHILYLGANAVAQAVGSIGFDI